MSEQKQWHEKRVRDICKLGRGRVISTQEIEKHPGIYPVYSSQSFNNGQMGAIDTYDFDGEYVTWTTDGAYAGTVFYRSGKFNCTNVCGTLSPLSDTLNIQFLAYKLSTVTKQYVSYVGNPKLMNGVVADIKLEIPKNNSEQAKIAEVLSTVDKAIAETEALIAKQQRIKTGLMQDLLTRGIDENGNLRSEETHQFKDSPLGCIPVEWDVERCMSLCTEIIVGIVIRPAQYYRQDGTIPILRSANVKINWIDPSDLVYMSERDNNILNKSQLRQGDLVTVRTGYPGTTSVISKEFDGCNCIDLVISRPNPKKIRSHYLSIWVNSSHGKRQILENQGGLAQQHFNVGEMKSLLVNVPTIKEQEIIENILLKQSKVVDELTMEVDKLKFLKTALMQDLLTGKKRVTPLLENNPIS